MSKLFSEQILERGLKDVRVRRPFPRRKPARANVVILHGYHSHMGHKGSMYELMRTLDDEYNVITCDLPGHGRSVSSEEDRGRIGDFSTLVNIARSMLFSMLRLPRYRDLPTFIIGYSLGSLIAIRLLQQLNSHIKNRVAGLVCVSALFGTEVNASEIVAKHREMLMVILPIISKIPLIQNISVDIPLLSRNTRELIDNDSRTKDDPLYYRGNFTISESFVIYCESEQAKEEFGKITLPALFIHAENDEVAPLEDVREAIGLIPKHKRHGKIEPVVYYDMEHDIFDKSEDIIPDIILWLEEELKHH